MAWRQVKHSVARRYVAPPEGQRHRWVSGSALRCWCGRRWTTARRVGRYRAVVRADRRCAAPWRVSGDIA